MWHKDIHGDPPTSERIYVSIYLRQEDHYNMYQREVMGFMEYLSDLGGIIGVFAAVGALITQPIVTRLINSEMVGSAYQLQRYNEDESVLPKDQTPKQSAQSPDNSN